MNERARRSWNGEYAFCELQRTDAEGHVTSARDIALMSRELITKYPQVHDYSMIWMEKHYSHDQKRNFGIRSYKYE